ncbi:MAG: adenosylcobinamide-GDP ribazoletransferase [Thermodesulfobacteriota bacterium]|nr:adenosylcobinamide-GDP ribazoletransferase [Thermodesulfobacteriota bacterium]
MIKGIRSAVGFATIIPVRGGDFNPREIAAALPAAGLLIGLTLAVFDAVAVELWSRSAAAALDVVFLAIITGALHIDGMADTVDGLYGGHTRERMLEIMKDSRVGAMGATAIVCCLIAKWTGLSALDHHRFLLLLLIPAYARAGSLFGFRFLEYGRGEEGTGSAFFDEPLTAADFRWLGLLVVFSLFSGWQMIWLNVGFVFITAAVIYFYKRMIGCITGDMLGAMIEVTEVVLLLLVAM